VRKLLRLNAEGWLGGSEQNHVLRADRRFEGDSQKQRESLGPQHNIQFQTSAFLVPQSSSSRHQHLAQLGHHSRQGDSESRALCSSCS
jgi:hypothetical protein